MQRHQRGFVAVLVVHVVDDVQCSDVLFSQPVHEVIHALHHFIVVQDVAFDRFRFCLVDVIHQRFVLAGARLDEADKAKLKVLNTEAATLTSQFNQRLLAANKSGGLVVDNVQQLAGMSEQDIALAAMKIPRNTSVR